MSRAQPAELKRFRLGTHRVDPPGETLIRVQPHLAAMGITRVANITGLDRIGCPVFTASRPNARSLSVSQGKGLDADAARVSAIMESVESFHAENIRAPLRYGSFEELQRTLPLADVAGLARSQAGQFHPQLDLFWIEGRNWLDESPLWLPLEAVSLDYALPFPPGSGCFAASSNGLASGNTLREAACHGICEVVERDATTLWKLSSHGQRAEGRIDLDSIDDADCREMLGLFESAGIAVTVWNVSSDIGIPSFCALVMGDDQDWADPEFGSGTHPAREVALLRALSEAAQARATFIAGVRDDLGDDLYRTEARRQRREYCLQFAGNEPGGCDFRQVPTYVSDSVTDDIAWVLQRVHAAGIEQVIVVDLSRPEFAVPVVRVVIPGLEGPAGHEQGDFVPGPRARRFARPVP